MSLSQLVLGAALGFMIAQGILYGIRQGLAWLERTDGRVPGQALLSAVVRYAGPVAASAALVTFGVWALSDYFAARSARAAEAATALEAPLADAPAADSHSEELTAASAPAASDVAPGAVEPDPYADPDYRVRRHARKAGAPLNLKDALLQKAEMKARTELLVDTQQHRRRSQYDCEAADHADKYLKADLDVWGFNSWQEKYFPVKAFRGATLPECRDIQDVVDHGSNIDLKSTVAADTHH